MWVAGSNTPGYLPDSPPATFDTFDEAKRWLIACLKIEEDGAGSEEEAETLCGFAEDVNLWSEGENEAVCLGVAYWITKE